MTQPLGCATYNFNFQEEDQTIVVQAQVYSPEQNDSNGHLIMVVNGAKVQAAEYSTLCHRFAGRGYHVLVADYQIDLQKQLPHIYNKPSIRTVPNLNVLHAILRNLTDDRCENIGSQENKLPRIQFNDVILFGHSLGGFYAWLSVLDPIPDEYTNNGFYAKYAVMKKDSTWRKYVKGVIMYEGWTMSLNCIIPKDIFLVLLGSSYHSQYIDHFKTQCGESGEVGFHVFDKANHYLVTNFYDEKQVAPLATIATGQENFTTTKEDWEKDQEQLANIVDQEIRARLDNDVNAVNTLKILHESKLQYA
eukprot:TRINITY_DN1891_c0_g2_i1.p2 TRINITY_DN1891_c0_g2~~TRINITY_DN1891_c0_g2_i1.p2  ORF type:complete len:305 (-),score=18.42 TRINITY_DN1891_c0_g2_i1:336-1250(-)